MDKLSLAGVAVPATTSPLPVGPAGATLGAGKDAAGFAAALANAMPTSAPTVDTTPRSAPFPAPATVSDPIAPPTIAPPASAFPNIASTTAVPSVVPDMIAVPPVGPASETDPQAVIPIALAVSGPLALKPGKLASAAKPGSAAPEPRAAPGPVAANAGPPVIPAPILVAADVITARVDRADPAARAGANADELPSAAAAPVGVIPLVLAAPAPLIDRPRAARTLTAFPPSATPAAVMGSSTAAPGVSDSNPVAVADSKVDAPAELSAAPFQPAAAPGSPVVPPPSETRDHVISAPASPSAPAIPLPPLNASLPPAQSPTQMFAPPPAQPIALSPAFGERIGLAIAHRVAQGHDEITVRLDPAELGRIEVRLGFDEHSGVLRAVVATQHASVLEALRRDSAELTRALNDAGLPTDGASLRFDSGGGDGGRGGQRSGTHSQAQRDWTRWAGSNSTELEQPIDAPRRIFRRGRLDFTA